MGFYRYVLIETFRNYGEPSSKNIRARPLPGQGLSTDMKVECSSKMRMKHPVGTIFKIRAQVTDRDGGGLFLYTSWQWTYEILTKEQADDYIATGGNK